MDREHIYMDIKKTLGLVPTMFKSIPDGTLELEWELFKKLQLDEGTIPSKYRELIGLGIAAATKCRYCTFFHAEVAKMCGATEAEIEYAMHFAKTSSGWSTYVNGLQLDYETFKSEVLEISRYLQKKSEK